MSKRTDAPVYYCTHCKLETTLARVCPKCHRRGTLVVKDAEGTAKGTTARERRRGDKRGKPPSSPAGPSKGPRTKHPPRGSGSASRKGPSANRDRVSALKTRPWLLIGLAAVPLALAGAGLGAWLLLRSSPKEDGNPQANQPTAAGLVTPPHRKHHFGAPRPGHRPPPATAPKRCGTKYLLRVEALFAPDTGPGGDRSAGGSSSKGTTNPALGPSAPPDSAPRPRPAPSNRPESSVTLQTFLVAGTGPSIEWILISTERSFRIGGKEVTVLRMDSEGALAMDPRERKLRRIGPEDELAPGLRPGDLVGHALANLKPNPQGGLGVKRLRRSEPLVKGLVHDSLSIITWLTPRFPEKGGPRYTDTRTPPRSLIHGLGKVRRDFIEAPRTKGAAAQERRYLMKGTGQIAAPRSKTPGASPGGPAKPGAPGPQNTPEANSTKHSLPPVQLTGEVIMAREALLPSWATMRVTGLIPGRPAAKEIIAELKAIGAGCNR